MECDIPQFYAWSILTARKQHDCCECSAKINPGEKYFRCSGKWDGLISSYKQHLLCEQACEFIRDEIENECIPFGSLFEWLKNEDYLKHYKKDIEVKDLRVMIAKIRRRELGRTKT